MNVIVLNSIRFVSLVLFQILVLNSLTVGEGFYPMIYPLFILLLPFEISTVLLLFLSFFIGLTVDAFSNTFGLHASSALIFAYLRPIIFKLFSPRDGYENVEVASIYSMGFTWFLYTYGTLLLTHTTWYFVVEQFKLNELGLVLKKMALSIPASFLLSLLVQFIFMNKKKAER